VDKKLTFSMIIILVIGMLSIAAQIKRVNAIGTIYIKSDGSIEPIDAPITTSDNVTYTFTNNTTSSVVVQKSNIIINGTFHTVRGNGTAAAGNGFTLNSVNNVTIKNVNIRDFWDGIYIQSGSNNKIIGNNLTNNRNYAFEFSFSSSNNLTLNLISGNRYSFLIRGSSLTHFSHLIDASNLVDEKPVYYLLNQSNIVINPITYQQIGFLALVNSHNVTVEGLTLTGKRQGLMLAYTSNSRIRDNDMRNNYYGFWLYSSSDNVFSRNNLTNNEVGIIIDHSSRNSLTANNLTGNDFFGIQLLSSLSNSVTGNNIISNTGSGISLSESSNFNSILGNNLTNNKNGIAFDLSSSHNTVSGNNVTLSTVSGIEIFDSSNNNAVSGNYLENNTISIEIFDSLSNSISGNNITRNSYFGVILDLSDLNIISGNNLTSNDVSISLDTSNSNSLLVNNFTENQVCIQLYESSNNKFFHNNFLNSTVRQVDILTSGYANVWDDGYPSGGNHWSDYTGVDANADGIGDTSYVIDADNQDRYPLMKLYVPPLQPPPDTTPPTVSVISPENKTYNARGVPLTFTLSEQVSWIGYSLNGQANLTIGGNTTIVGLSDGVHSVKIYANDTAGNMGFSETVYFTVQVISEDITPPSITILSPENTTYTTADIPLTFTVSEPVQWIAYSLDSLSNVTVTGNTTLTGISEGSHGIVIYALDTIGNVGASEKRYFTVEITSPPPPETNPPFPPTWVIAAFVIIIAGVAVALLVYFKKFRKQPRKSD
jgi:parallel beta-helix repeat protein